jgi:hypothetical protein
VYLGGALFPTTMIEADYCRRWIEAVRGSDEPALRTASILIRPHPKRVEEWRTGDFSDLEDVVVWPENVEFPAEQATRADYFDSIYHSAVAFGINTTALIEAGIIGKAVHTITVPEFASSQGGVLHFRYLREIGGGLVQVSETLDENVRRLGDVVAGRDTEGEEAARRFTELFVRPNGVQVPATPVFVDSVEELAARGPHPREHDARWLVLLRPPLALIRVPFFLTQVRLKVALESRRLGARLGLVR